MNADGGSARLTLEQILEALTEIAQTGSPAERLKALALLAKQEGPGAAVIMLPDPLTDAEVVERLARLDEAAGATAARLAYRRAFPRVGEVTDPVEALIQDLPQEIREKVANVRSVKGLYRCCPALKRPGRPDGFPIKGGPMERIEWCQNQAARFLLEQLNRETQSPRDPEEATLNGQ